jgi:Flp pilus assembly protein TadG
MRRMSRPGRGDRGAVAIIVAMLFGFGVMIAAAALTIDVGRINLDRRQLQNGADAAALSAAQDCIKTKCPNMGVTADKLRLEALADGNAGADQASAIARVDGKLALCGTPTVKNATGVDVATGLTACDVPANSSNLQECPQPRLPSDSVPGATETPYLRVFTQTLNAAKTQTLLPYTFGAMFAGAGSGANQQACASVAWGPVGAYTASVPITISLCMFDAMVASYGGTLPPAPDSTWPGYGHVGSPWPSLAAEQIEYTTKYAGTCDNSADHATNGSFGWLTNSNCQVTVTSGKWINGSPGNNFECPDLYKYWGTTVNLPIFDCIQISNSDPVAPPPVGSVCVIPTGGGSNVWYHIRGWASFYLSGYRFSGAAGADTTPNVASATKVSLLSQTAPCSEPESCLSGWLTKGEVSAAPIGIPGTPDYGLKGLQVVG